MEQQELTATQKTFKGFGGSLLKGAHARSPRPVSCSNAMHIVMRSEVAKGTRSLRHRNHHQKVNQIVRAQAAAWGIRIYNYANVGNHIHILLRPSSRRRFMAFIRSISGLIARAVLGAERGRARGIRFWQARPFTRIVKWGKDYVIAKQYVDINGKEALGFWRGSAFNQPIVFRPRNTS